MASQSATPGLSIGQLVTLTFGFLVASVLIFAFGWWVGYDVAEQRLAHDQQIVRLPVKPLPPAPTETPLPPTRPPGTPSATPTFAPPTSTPTRAIAPPTSTRTILILRIATPTAAMAPVDEVEEPVDAGEPGAGALESATGWTVQASATTDPVQAVVLARRLRAKGFDAYTVTAPIGGVMWYRTRVGRFKDRNEAKAVEERLQREEGLEAAFVAAQ